MKNKVLQITRYIELEPYELRKKSSVTVILRELKTGQGDKTETSGQPTFIWVGCPLCANKQYREDYVWITKVQENPE